MPKEKSNNENSPNICKLCKKDVDFLNQAGFCQDCSHKSYLKGL